MNFVTLWVLLKQYDKAFMVLTIFLLYNMTGSMWWSSSYFENTSIVSLSYLCIITGTLILMVESSTIVRSLSSALVLICIVFFSSSNLFLLFIMFELSLFPILFAMVMFGTQVERVSAVSYMFIYTLFFSLPLLYIVWSEAHIGAYFNNISLLGAVLISLPFLVKFPVYFLHLWLPKAHVESPTFGSILLASLLLKLGTMGYMRMVWHMKPQMLDVYIMVGIMGMFAASAICIWQSDIKSLVAYSSVCHMSLVLVGLSISMSPSTMGSVLMMLFHGTTSGMMFYVSGTLYHTYNTRMMYYVGGLLQTNLLFSFLTLMTMVLNFSVPPSGLFLSEVSLVACIYMLAPGFLYLLGAYLLIVCYFSLFFLTNSLMGKKTTVISTESASMISFAMLAFNFVLLSFLV